VAGQLTAFSIQVGQSLNRGERLGQIDSAGRNKLVAQVDEFYLGRVEPGQVATVETGGKTFKAKVAKIYPQVRNGAFEVDLHFIDAEPAELQRGQTLQVRLTLGDPTPALLIPNGAFYNETGGAYVFDRHSRWRRRGEAYRPPRPPQRRIYRSAGRAGARRARHHLTLHRFRRSRSAGPRNLKKEPKTC
jgi:hypothetical protein